MFMVCLHFVELSLSVRFNCNCQMVLLIHCKIWGKIKKKIHAVLWIWIRCNMIRPVDFVAIMN